MSLPDNTRWIVATGFGCLTEVMWRIFQDGKKSQLGTRFTLHEVTKKKTEVLRFDRSVTLSLHRRNFRIFFGLNNANLFTETIAPPPHPPAERWLSCRSHQRQLKPKQAQHQLVLRGLLFTLDFTWNYSQPFITETRHLNIYMTQPSGASGTARRDFYVHLKTK